MYDKCGDVGNCFGSLLVSGTYRSEFNCCRMSFQLWNNSNHRNQFRTISVLFNTSSNGSRERPPAELNKVVELLWFCEGDVWSELTSVWKS